MGLDPGAGACAGRWRRRTRTDLRRVRICRVRVSPSERVWCALHAQPSAIQICRRERAITRTDGGIPCKCAPRAGVCTLGVCRVALVRAPRGGARQSTAVSCSSEPRLLHAAGFGHVSEFTVLSISEPCDRLTGAISHAFPSMRT